MVMQAVVLALAFVATTALRSSPNEPTQEMSAITRAIREEMDMFSSDTSEYAHSLTKSHSRNFHVENEHAVVVDDSASSVTVKPGEDGVPVCEGTCAGDPADMAHAFYRYNKEMKSPKTVDSFTVAKDTHFFNSADTRACLKDKYIVFLGDSTLSENLNDIEYLLAGGPQHVKVEPFMWSVSTQTKSTLSWDTSKGKMVDNYEYKNRKHKVNLKSLNTEMKFYFTGATELGHNCDGISAILDEGLRAKIAAYTEKEGRKPEAIVINSGPHDACHNWIKKDNYTTFFENLDKVGQDVVKPWVDQGIKVIFRGSYIFPGETAVDNPKYGDNRIPKKLDDAARAMIEKYGGKFADAANVIATTHDSSGCCSTIRSSTVAMPHLGSIAYWKDHKASVFLSQLITYKILDSICPGEI